MTLRTDELDFELDPARIARHPTAARADARMLVVDLESDRIEHRRVRDIGEYLRRGDQLVLNSTRVMAARFHCTRTDTGGRLEGLLLEEASPGRWWSMLRKSRRLRPGHELRLLEHDGSPAEDTFRVLEVEDGRVLLELDGQRPVEEVLARLGSVPLPPYIRNARRDAGEPVEDPRDADWYQTVYAHLDAATRSVAAPTAGLHLSRPLLADLRAAGVGVIEVELEVGAGTFKPVEAEFLADHPMHRERCVVQPGSLSALQALQQARREGRGRVIPVGTTATRTLESLPESWPENPAEPLVLETELLIQPGFEFRFMDGLLTNFHLPRSTLLALVAAVCGLDRLHAIYREAIAEEYRFFSYGDAMLLIGDGCGCSGRDGLADAREDRNNS